MSSFEVMLIVFANAGIAFNTVTVDPEAKTTPALVNTFPARNQFFLNSIEFPPKIFSIYIFNA